MESKCPDCGAGPWHPSKSGPQWGWECGSTPHNRELYGCIKRQLSAATQEVERLKRLESALLDDGNITAIVKNCTSPCHTADCCEWCDAKLDGIDKYQSLLIEILYRKDQPHA